MIVNKIPALMRVRDWTPGDLVRMGLPQNTVYRAVRGETNFTLDVIDKMCQALGVQIGDLFEYRADEPEKGDLPGSYGAAPAGE